MKVLVLGGSGMLGHKIAQMLSKNFNVGATIRRKPSSINGFPALQKIKWFANVDANKFDNIVKTFNSFQPDVVINCIGIVKQLHESNDPLKSININSLLPHKISNICSKAGARFIHFSTDCVFSGKTGNYSEKDIPDPIDLYGKSKLLGELENSNSLILRTSIIGHELTRHTSLLDWFLMQKYNKIDGYHSVIYSGLPTYYFGLLLENLLVYHEALRGLYHVSSSPISKFDLLSLVNKTYSLGIEIRKNREFKLNRSLDSSLFQKKTGLIPPCWEMLIEQTRIDSEMYKNLPTFENYREWNSNA